MLQIMICDQDRTHNRNLKEICFRYTFQENMDSEISVMETFQEIQTYMLNGDLKRLMMMGTGFLKKNLNEDILEQWNQHYLVLMADNIQDVVETVTPQIRPAGILLKPVEKEKAEQILCEIWQDYKKSVSSGEMFLVHTRNREYAILKESILFFESRNKKIVVRTMNQELEFYDTLEHIGKILNKTSKANTAGSEERKNVRKESEKLNTEDSFLRVHKSFLVNMNQVEMIHFSNMTIHFKGGAFALLSRTYKAKVMEEWKKREGGGR